MLALLVKIENLNGVIDDIDLFFYRCVGELSCHYRLDMQDACML